MIFASQKLKTLCHFDFLRMNFDMIDSKEKLVLPTHVGIIMDGNRRWARKHFLPASSGHSRGAETFKKLALYCHKIGLKYLTVYAFSTENWKRSEAEIKVLMALFKRYINSVMKEFKDENIKVKFIGNSSRFSREIQDGIKIIESETSHRTGLHLNIAMNYGSRAEISFATKTIAEKIASGALDVQEIDENLFQRHLYTSDCPDLDLVIRTAGEQRLSNFMLWQAAYAEFYFSDILWPDFSTEEFDKAISEYFTRTRKFGGQ